MSEFENVGLLTKANSGRSFKLSIEGNVYYVSIKNSLEVAEGHKKNVQIVRRVGKMRTRSCESRPS